MDTTTNLNHPIEETEGLLSSGFGSPFPYAYIIQLGQSQDIINTICIVLYTNPSLKLQYQLSQNQVSRLELHLLFYAKTSSLFLSFLLFLPLSKSPFTILSSPLFFPNQTLATLHLLPVLRFCPLRHGVRRPRLLDHRRGRLPRRGRARHREPPSRQGDRLRRGAARLRLHLRPRRVLHGCQSGRRRPRPRDFLCDSGRDNVLAGFLLHKNSVLCVQGLQRVLLL